MIVKSFVLKPRTISRIAPLCTPETIAVVRPGKKIEALFRKAVHETVDLKRPALEQMTAIREHFSSMAKDEAYLAKVDETVDALSTYLREAMYVQTSAVAIEDYVLAKCSRLCAEAVNARVKGTILDGTQLMVCSQDAAGHQHFDWVSSGKQISERCRGLAGPVVISGGYGMLTTGYVVRVGRDGAHLMASLIASVLSASSIEFHIEAQGVAGIPAMTYDEAAHYCASPQAPFCASAIWPAKNAGIPILVKSIDDEKFEGTVISTGSAHRTEVIADKNLSLVTVYGTGLWGSVGMSGAIFSCLARAGVNVRFIAQTCSEYSISFAVAREQNQLATKALKGLFKENPLLPLEDVVVVDQAVGIITVFGSSMKNLPGTSGAVFGKLGKAGINVIASAQGGEELSISLVLDQKDIDKATEVLK